MAVTSVTPGNASAVVAFDSVQGAVGYEVDATLSADIPAGGGTPLESGTSLNADTLLDAGGLADPDNPGIGTPLEATTALYGTSQLDERGLIAESGPTVSEPLVMPFNVAVIVAESASFPFQVFQAGRVSASVTFPFTVVGPVRVVASAELIFNVIGTGGPLGGPRIRVMNPGAAAATTDAVFPTHRTRIGTPTF